MRKSRFYESQIVQVLKQVEGGRQVKDVCRELGIWRPPITVGSPSTVEWRPQMCGGSRS
jgi:hypothetical protein